MTDETKSNDPEYIKSLVADIADWLNNEWMSGTYYVHPDTVYAEFSAPDDPDHDQAVSFAINTIRVVAAMLEPPPARSA